MALAEISQKPCRLPRRVFSLRKCPVFVSLNNHSTHPFDLKMAQSEPKADTMGTAQKWVNRERNNAG